MMFGIAIFIKNQVGKVKKIIAVRKHQRSVLRKSSEMTIRITAYLCKQHGFTVEGEICCDKAREMGYVVEGQEGIWWIKRKEKN